MNLTYVSHDLTAWHTDPRPGPSNEGRHEHTWRVTTYFHSEPRRDADALKAALFLILEPWQGTDLPPELWAAEDIAAAVLQLHGNADCCGVRVHREREGSGATAGVCS